MLSRLGRRRIHPVLTARRRHHAADSRAPAQSPRIRNTRRIAQMYLAGVGVDRAAIKASLTKDVMK
jgi:hypothetical protein